MAEPRAGLELPLSPKVAAEVTGHWVRLVVLATPKVMVEVAAQSLKLEA